MWVTRGAESECARSAAFTLCNGRTRRHGPTRGGSPGANTKGTHNKRVNLTGRPVTRLAGEAPPHISANGGGQGARPSRPAGYARR